MYTRWSRSIKHINWTELEKIKDGCFYSRNSTVTTNRPILICFANREPDIDLLSRDKWEIVEIQND